MCVAQVVEQLAGALTVTGRHERRQLVGNLGERGRLLADEGALDAVELRRLPRGNSLAVSSGGVSRPQDGLVPPAPALH